MGSKDKIVLCRVVWRRTMDDQSMEYCTITRHPDGLAISGHVIGAEQGQPLDVTYDIRCGSDWAANSVEVTQAWGGETRSLRLERTTRGWLIDSAPASQLDGCLEPDLGLTPSTNALAIRRLDLEVGQATDIKAAWVKFPALTAEPSCQRYERLGPSEYRYTNLASGFTAILTVDDLALPVSYERIWTRIANWHGDAS